MNDLEKAGVHSIFFYCIINFSAFSRVKLWASAFGGEMKSISAKYSGSQLLQKVSIEALNWNFNVTTL